MKRMMLLTGVAMVLFAGSAMAAEIAVTDNIVTSEEWTADNVYNLQNQIFVMPGATLTIQPGTLIQSTAGVGGSLAVTRGARIYVNGTQEAPVIMTSSNDDLTTWREAANEWGNLTIMGEALISGSHYDGVAQSYQDGATATVHTNTKEPDGLNKKTMEGLVAEFQGDPKVLYGGGNDDDNSGALRYLSIRYGGRITAQPNKELNGLSMGGVGRETDVDHVDIMNNVDDGIETWGGTVNYKYVSIWNIGDDSFDVDEGWRGKAQFGLIVQGYSLDASQGSGVGDNCFETDGAEESDAQPVTTANIYNFTVVGQPIAGDHGTAWRDNARVQYHNCVFMDLGEQLVKFDGDDGDGQAGYGFNGTLSWEETWATPYTETSTVNAGSWTPGAFNDPSVLYQSQTSGMLAEMKDCVFYNNLHADAYTEATARGVMGATSNNVLAATGEMPIQAITRGAPVVKGGKTLVPVEFINPCAANAATTSVGAAPADGFFSSVHYRGGFDSNTNWLLGWTAASAYGMTSGPAEVLVTQNISTSTTWTSDKIYNLQDQIFVMPGATLTIEPGTLVRSTAGVGGSLAVTRGGRIYANGTKNAPIIMTSSLDNLTSWHEGANEWGNLTLMGQALISASHYDGVAQSYQDGATAAVHMNTKEPDGLNKKTMEGLVAEFQGDPKVLYGGANDDDNSGSLSYLSIRYGGRITAQPNKELNGLSMGGIGRETDVNHVEIMNNVDDGIETWGGTVNYKYINIWNIGDDSFDVDEGWRGKAQFGLIVQGYSLDAAQGSGVGDNCFETDGAEESDAQPVTTANIYNFTVVGQPIAGDHGTAWRDNARVQYHNCIFMDLGEQLVKFDGDDGDGQAGYGFNGTLSWEETWTTPYNETPFVNAGDWTPGAFNDPAVLYQAQTSGMLAEMKDSVFYNNNHAEAYTEADARGVRDTGNDNVTATMSPIQALTRGAAVQKGGKTLLPVEFINPCAANAAVTSVAMAPNDGFFTPAPYRGGFSPNWNWLEGWTAVDAYGMTDTSMNIPGAGSLVGDLNSDGVVDAKDLLILDTAWHRSN